MVQRCSNYSPRCVRRISKFERKNLLFREIPRKRWFDGRNARNKGAIAATSSSLEIVCSSSLPTHSQPPYLSSSRFFVAGHKADAQQTRFSPLLPSPTLVGPSLINRDAILGRPALSTSPIKRGDVVMAWYIACSGPDSQVFSTGYPKRESLREINPWDNFKRFLIFLLV